MATTLALLGALAAGTAFCAWLALRLRTPDLRGADGLVPFPVAKRGRGTHRAGPAAEPKPEWLTESMLPTRWDLARARWVEHGGLGDFLAELDKAMAPYLSAELHTPEFDAACRWAAVAYVQKPPDVLLAEVCRRAAARAGLASDEEIVSTGVVREVSHARDDLGRVTGT